MRLHQILRHQHAAWTCVLSDACARASRACALAPHPAGLLVVALQAGGQGIVHHKPHWARARQGKQRHDQGVKEVVLSHADCLVQAAAALAGQRRQCNWGAQQPHTHGLTIGLVDAHAERDGRHNDLQSAAYTTVVWAPSFELLNRRPGSSDPTERRQSRPGCCRCSTHTGCAHAPRWAWPRGSACSRRMGRHAAAQLPAEQVTACARCWPWRGKDSTMRACLERPRLRMRASATDEALPAGKQAPASLGRPRLRVWAPAATHEMVRRCPLRCTTPDSCVAIFSHSGRDMQ